MVSRCWWVLLAMLLVVGCDTSENQEQDLENTAEADPTSNESDSDTSQCETQDPEDATEATDPETDPNCDNPEPTDTQEEPPNPLCVGEGDEILCTELLCVSDIYAGQEHLRVELAPTWFAAEGVVKLSAAVLSAPTFTHEAAVPMNLVSADGSLTWTPPAFTLDLSLSAGGTLQIVVEKHATLQEELYIGTILAENMPESWQGPAQPIALTCWHPQVAAPFAYHADAGNCQNETGQIGENPWTLEMMRETKNAECVTIPSDPPLIPLVANWVVSDWNFQGSTIGSADAFSVLQNIGIIESDFRGATWHYAFFYSCVTGTIDANSTGFPELCVVSDEGDTIVCDSGCPQLGVDLASP